MKMIKINQLFFGLLLAMSSILFCSQERDFEESRKWIQIVEEGDLAAAEKLLAARSDINIPIIGKIKGVPVENASPLINALYLELIRKFHSY
ncbi:MAG: hypothetical protein WCD44_03520 [Candidatus Babeliales bacterium]